MGKLFETRQIKKTYWAIVHGGPKEESGTVNDWLNKSFKGKLKPNEKIALVQFYQQFASFE